MKGHPKSQVSRSQQSSLLCIHEVPGYYNVQTTSNDCWNIGVHVDLAFVCFVRPRTLKLAISLSLLIFAQAIEA